MSAGTHSKSYQQAYYVVVLVPVIHGVPNRPSFLPVKRPAHHPLVCRCGRTVDTVRKMLLLCAARKRCCCGALLLMAAEKAAAWERRRR